MTPNISQNQKSDMKELKKIKVKLIRFGSLASIKLNPELSQNKGHGK